MSSSQSVDSAGEMVGASDLPPSSPSSQSQQRCPVTPGDEAIATVPKNPFDSLVDIPPLPSLAQSGSLTDSLPLHHISSIPGINSPNLAVEQNQQTLVANLSEKSISPDRSFPVQSPMQHGSPNLLQAAQTPANLSSCDKSVSSGTLIPSSTPITQQLPLPGLPQTPDQFALTDHQVPHSPLRHPAVALPTTVFLTSSTQEPSINFDDDEKTEPSSAANTAEQSNIDNRDGQVPNQQNSADFVAGSIMRFLQDTRRLIVSKNVRKDSDEDNMPEGSLISGYLQKYGRNGKWQTRWFETDGECLSYYKNSKRSKLLATLDLEKVGTIEVDPEDARERSFTIQVLGRMYHLRADSRASCRDWVITLNRVKEARLQQGNVKLYNHPVDLLDSSDVTPRVVVVANRQRTRAVDESEQWEQLYQMPADPADPAYIEQKRLSALGTTVVGRWSKRHSSLQRLGNKLVQWARSVKKYGCQDMDGQKVHLDQHIHPPGQTRTQLQLPGDQNTLSPVNASFRKPGKPKRSMSSASEEYRTIS